MIGEGGQMPYQQRMHFQNAELDTRDSGMTYVGLSYPCRGKYDYELIHHELVCEHREPHGHVIIFCMDEACIMPAAIQSRSMLGSVLARLVQQSHLTREEMRTILGQTNTTKLQADLTDGEKNILSHPKEFDSFCDLGGFYRF